MTRLGPLAGQLLERCAPEVPWLHEHLTELGHEAHLFRRPSEYRWPLRFDLADAWVLEVWPNPDGRTICGAIPTSSDRDPNRYRCGLPPLHECPHTAWTTAEGEVCLTVLKRVPVGHLWHDRDGNPVGGVRQDDMRSA